MAERKPFLPSSPQEHIFPRLTPAQLDRVASHGRVRPVGAGEVLLEAGDPATRIFVVTSGQVEGVLFGDVEQLVAVVPTNHVTGEMKPTTRRRMRAPAPSTEPGEALGGRPR